MANEDRLLTVNEVAERLRVHPITVRRHIKAGDLRAVRVGRAVRVRESDLKEYVGAEDDGWTPPDPEKMRALRERVREMLKDVDIEPPHPWPPTEQEKERLKKISEDMFRRRDERGNIGISTTELVRQGRRELEEKYERTSGASSRRFRRDKMASDRREPYRASD